MADTQVLSTLDTKRKEIESHIGSLERDLEQARRDLSAILAAIKVFSAAFLFQCMLAIGAKEIRLD